MSESSLEVSDRLSAEVQKTPNRVSLASIKDKIASVEYYNPPIAPHMTVAFVEMSNGFILVGKSAPADSDNYNKELGEKFAFEDAVRQAWPLEAYNMLTDALRDGYFKRG